MKKYNFLFLMIFASVSANFLMAQSPVNCIKDEPTVSVDIPPGTVIVPFDLPPREQSPPPPSEGPGRDRMIFLLHGLGSNTLAWTQVENSIEHGAPGFPARKARAHSFTYNEYSLEDAAQSLETTIAGINDSDDIDPRYNFVIGHSQGGLVGRSLDQVYQGQEWDRRMNGVATFGSAHQGALLLNNISMLGDLLDEGMVAISKGKITEIVESTWFIDLFFDAEDIENYVDKVGDFFNSIVLPLAIFPSETAGDGLEYNPQNIIEDYMVGAPYIQGLNNAPTNMARAAFYGVENEPVAFRALSSFLNDPNEAPEFAADDDQIMVNVAIDNQNKFLAEYEWWKHKTDLAENSNLPIWLAWHAITDDELYGEITASYEEALEIQDAYYAGYDWWYKANDRFKMITGALSTVQGASQVICECEDPSTGWSVEFDGPCTGSENCVEHNVVTYDLLEKPSDGIVLAESGSNFPGAATMLLPGSNHSQMKNDSNTRTALLALFNGEMGDFFTTAIQE